MRGAWVQATGPPMWMALQDFFNVWLIGQRIQTRLDTTTSPTLIFAR